jgi:hypothetical protein
MTQSFSKNSAIVGGRPTEEFVMACHSLSNLKYGLAISLALIAPSLAHADTLFVDTWSSNASAGGDAISGQLVYDATNNTIVSDTTAVAGVCTSGACLLTPFNDPSAGSALDVGAATAVGEPKYIAFAQSVPPITGGLGVPGYNPIISAYDITFGTDGGLPVTGGLFVSPGPTPGEGLLSVALILLVGLSARFRSLIV